jgi:hypothetical protein
MEGKPSIRAEKRDVGNPREVLTVEKRDTWKPSASAEKRDVGNPIEMWIV